MQVGFRLVCEAGRDIGELRICLKPHEAGEFSAESLFYLQLEGGRMQLSIEVPDNVEPVALSSGVEHKSDETVATFKLDLAQVEILRSHEPGAVPENLRISYGRAIGFGCRIRAMTIDADDGEHHCLLVAPQSVFDDIDLAEDASFELVLDGDAWQDSGQTCYLDQKINIHFDAPELPCLVPRGKKITTRGVRTAVWELEDEAVKATFGAWSEAWNRRRILESN